MPGGPLLHAGDTVQFRVWTTCNDQAAVTTHHFRVGTITGLVDLADASLSFDSVMQTAYKSIISSQARYNGVQARLLNQIPPFVSQDTITNAGPGLAGPVCMSRQTCGITSYYTLFAGPGNRGRTYWPFPPASGDETFGEPNDAYIEGVETLVGLMMISFVITGSGGSAPAVFCLHVKRTPASPIPITFAETRRKWATQKRRGSYGRQNTSPI